MENREKISDHIKKSIIKNALCLFREKGYNCVSVEEITRVTGISKGSFYTYFKTKSDIIVEEFRKIDRYYDSYASRALPGLKTPADKLRAFTRAQMSYINDKIGVDNLKILYSNQILGNSGLADNVIVDPGRRWYRIVELIIVEGQIDGSFRSDINALNLAKGFNRSIRSIFLDWCLTNGNFNLEKESLKYLTEWLMPAISRSGA